jgi:hypothetical protein
MEVNSLQQQLETQRRKVDVDHLTITIRELVSMVERRELRRAPTYQRKFRWPEHTESRLIESIFLGLPVPDLFFATNSDGTWDVVDGLQRVSTLIHFLAPSPELLREIGKSQSLVLQGLDKLSDFNDQVFDSLPTPLQLMFTKRGLGVTALSDKSDPDTRFDAFERLNRGAVALTPQEVRACVYKGPLNALLRELADSEDFRMLVKLRKVDQENATREELVLKFFAYFHELDRFEGSVTVFLNDYMNRNQYTFNVQLGSELFNKVVQALLQITKGPVLRHTTNVTPQNELEAVMVGAARVLEEHNTLGKPSREWLEDAELVRASTGGANNPRKLRDRVNRAAELLTP